MTPETDVQKLGSRNDIREGFGVKFLGFGGQIFRFLGGWLLRCGLFLVLCEGLVGVRKSFGRFWGKELFGG